MQNFIIHQNNFLRQNIQAFCHANYVGYREPGNPDYINTLKNTYNNLPNNILNNAVRELRAVLLEDLPQILPAVKLSTLTICVVPRAKTNYHPNQLLFKTTVGDVVKKFAGFVDGTDYIVRHTNTRTTHLPPNIPNYNNDGDLPYPGITKDTCNISNEVRDKNILLIDDLYTRTVNIDEDAIQALLNSGAQSVIFYAVGKTVHNEI